MFEFLSEYFFDHKVSMRIISVLILKHVTLVWARPHHANICKLIGFPVQKQKTKLASYFFKELLRLTTQRQYFLMSVGFAACYAIFGSWSRWNESAEWNEKDKRFRAEEVNKLKSAMYLSTYLIPRTDTTPIYSSLYCFANRNNWDTLSICELLFPKKLKRLPFIDETEQFLASKSMKILSFKL